MELSSISVHIPPLRAPPTTAVKTITEFYETLLSAKSIDDLEPLITVLSIRTSEVDLDSSSAYRSLFLLQHHLDKLSKRFKKFAPLPSPQCDLLREHLGKKIESLKSNAAFNAHLHTNPEALFVKNCEEISLILDCTSAFPHDLILPKLQAVHKSVLSLLALLEGYEEVEQSVLIAAWQTMLFEQLCPIYTDLIPQHGLYGLKNIKELLLLDIQNPYPKDPVHVVALNTLKILFLPELPEITSPLTAVPPFANLFRSFRHTNIKLSNKDLVPSADALQKLALLAKEAFAAIPVRDPLELRKITLILQHEKVLAKFYERFDTPPCEEFIALSKEMQTRIDAIHSSARKPIYFPEGYMQNALTYFYESMRPLEPIDSLKIRALPFLKHLEKALTEFHSSMKHHDLYEQNALKQILRVLFISQLTNIYVKATGVSLECSSTDFSELMLRFANSDDKTCEITTRFSSILKKIYS